MALLLMTFLTGLEGDRYQEVLNGQVTRWFDTDGNEVTLPDNNGQGVSYTLKNDNPPVPSWYTPPSNG
jgi:hypothetical protein